ncbi:MAG: flagellar basal body-associated FliL family protein [Marmoricola sp.]
MTVTAIPQAAAPAGAAAAEPPAKGGKKKIVIILVAVLVLGGGGGYYMFGRPKPVGPPKPGVVVKLDPIQINLASEHYLRIGIALQLVAGVKEADGSKALDATIELFSGLPMAEVNDGKKRDELKKELVKELEERYEKEVMGVYFTELVTQ